MRRLMIAVALCALLAGCGGSSPSFSGAVASWRPLDLGRISVTFDVRNDGNVATRVGCSLDAVIPSGNTVQKMSVSSHEVRPGSSLRMSDVIPIPDQGAFLVDHVTTGPCEGFGGGTPSAS